MFSFFTHALPQRRPRTSSTTSSFSSAPRDRHHTGATRHYPEALPCVDYYDRFPEDAGPLGNVEVHCRAELQRWLLTARPVSAEEAERHGGCIKFEPLCSGASATSAVQPQYFCITDPDDVVYGRAHYISVATPTETATLSTSARKTRGDFFDDTTEDALTTSDVSSHCSVD